MVVLQLVERSGGIQSRPQSALFGVAALARQDKIWRHTIALGRDPGRPTSLTFHNRGALFAFSRPMTRMRSEIATARRGGQARRVRIHPHCVVCPAMSVVAQPASALPVVS
jgi:hypothetical protein